MPKNRTISRVCEACGRDFFAYASHVKATGAKFCSYPCYWASLTGPKNSLICAQCGNNFTVAPNKTKSGRRYCSAPCSHAHSRGRSKITDPESHFWSRVEKTDSCWLWLGSKAHTGHGTVRWQGRSIGAYRVAWMLTNGPIPDGLSVCHNCPGGDNPACVRPDHLFLGTQSDNTVDAWRKNRISRGENRRNSKLTESDVRAIRVKSRVNEMSQRQLAREFGVSSNVIRAILLGRTWKHVE